MGDGRKRERAERNKFRWAPGASELPEFERAEFRQRFAMACLRNWRRV